MALIVQVLVALLIAGFLYWAATAILAKLSFLPEIIRGIIEVLLLILVVAVVLFYAVIPALHTLAGISINVTH